MLHEVLQTHHPMVFMQGIQLEKLFVGDVHLFTRVWLGDEGIYILNVTLHCLNYHSGSRYSSVIQIKHFGDYILNTSMSINLLTLV